MRQTGMQVIRAQAKQFALGCKRILAWTLREKSSVNEAQVFIWWQELWNVLS